MVDTEPHFMVVSFLKAAWHRKGRFSPKPRISREASIKINKT
jgi:hypothetical protein